MPMKLKLDDEGHVVVQDGKPVYIGDDGKEVALDADYTLSTITRLNNEAKEHREAKEHAEQELHKWQELEEVGPETALKAIETVKNLDQGTLVSAGRVKEIQDAAQKAAENQVEAAIKAGQNQLKEITGERDLYRSELHSEKIGGAFSRSKFISEKCAMPIDMVQSRFGPQFKYEDKRVVGYDSSGNKIYSRSKPGELADFDEAMEVIIDSYPYKDQILKGTNNSGAGSEHSASGGDRTRMLKGNMGGSQKERAAAIANRWPELESKNQ